MPSSTTHRIAAAHGTHEAFAPHATDGDALSAAASLERRSQRARPTTWCGLPSRDSWQRPQEPARALRAALGVGAGALLSLDAGRRILLPGQGAAQILGVPELLAGAQLLTHMPHQVTAAWHGTWYQPADPRHRGTHQRILLVSSMVSYISLARQGLQELVVHGPSSWAFLAAAQGVPGAVALGVEVARPRFFVFNDRYYARSAQRITAALLPTAFLLLYDAWAAWPSSLCGVAVSTGAAVGAAMMASYTHQLREARLTHWRHDICGADLCVSMVAFGTAIGTWGLRRLNLFQ